MYRVLLIAIILSIFSGSYVYAQFENASLESDIAITVTPQNPEPGESITLEAKSYSVDLNQANIVWRYNGKIISSGFGKNRITTVAPNSNSSALITATVNVSGIAQSTTAITIRTASIDMLWEAADSYTPPFYKGKALLSKNGLVRVVAIPNISSPKNMSFEWTKNDNAEPGASGYNKDSFVFVNKTLQQEERVEVSAQSGFFGGSSSLTIVPTAPKLLLYKKIEGFVDYANGYISDLATEAPGIILRLEPYFFSVPKNITQDLDFDIKNNDDQIYGNKNPNEISLSAPDEKGEASIDVIVHTNIYSLQNTINRFKILFK